MSPLHLLWIVPLSMGLGLFLAAMLNANREKDDEQSNNL